MGYSSYAVKKSPTSTHLASPGTADVMPMPYSPVERGTKMAVKHIGFKKAQASIAAKQGISQKAAGAILAAGARNASSSAKKANPRLKRVGLKKKKSKGS